MVRGAGFCQTGYYAPAAAPDTSAAVRNRIRNKQTPWKNDRLTSIEGSIGYTNIVWFRLSPPTAAHQGLSQLYL